MLSRTHSQSAITCAIIVSLISAVAISEAAPPFRVVRPQVSPVGQIHARPVWPLNSLPDAFDLRDEGRAAQSYPPTGCAACWADAATYVMESLLLPWEETDLSEAHIQMTQNGGCDGGGSLQGAISYLAAWNGPIAESDYRQLVLYGMKARERLRLRQARVLPMRKNALDNAAIKRAIYQHGPLYASVNGRGVTNLTYNTSYWPYNSAIHAVALIGWDDGIPQAHFTYTYQDVNYTPGGDGGFLVKDNGGRIYHLSYYDGAIGYNTVGWFAVEPFDTETHIHQYDPHGSTSTIGPYQIPGNTPDDSYLSAIYGANLFTATQRSVLTSVGFQVLYYYFSDSDPARVEVAIHLDPDNGPVNSQGAALSFTTQLSDGGYYSLDLPKAIPLAAGQRYAVVLRGHRSAKEVDAMYLPVEVPSPNYTMDIKAGQSFVSRDGQQWHDMIDVPYNGSQPDSVDKVFGNLGIKAYTGTASGNLKGLAQLRPYQYLRPPWRPVFVVDSAPVPETATPQPGSTVSNENPIISLRFNDDVKPGPALAEVSLSTYNETRQIHTVLKGDTLLIHPVGPLVSGELGGKQWTVRVPADAVVDRWNNPMEQDYSWSFEVIGVN